MSPFKKYKDGFYALLLFFIPFLWALANFPYLFIPSRYLYGYPSDKLPAVWEYWWKGNLAQSPLDGRLAGGINQWLYDALRNFLALFADEVLIYNLLYLLVFELAFLSLYLLSVRLTRSRSAAVVAALIFSSSQYFLWHTMQNIEIPLAASLLPLYFFCLWRLENLLEERAVSWLRKIVFVFGAALVFSSVFLFSFYLGYFAGLATLAFVLFFRWYRRWVEGRPLITKPFLLYSFLFVFFSFLLTLPGTGSLIAASLKSNSGEAATTLQAVINLNREANLVAYGARPWDYLLPSPNHPLFGRWVESFYRYLRENKSYQFWSTFLPERPNYLTVTALFLAVYAAWHFLKRSDPPAAGRTFTDDRRNILVFAFLALVMFLVSLPAVITVRGVNVYLPSFFLFKLFPMFRVYARAGVFVLLGVSILAGCGWKLILDKLNNRRSALVATVGVVLLIFFENLNFPPFPVMDAGHVPGVYSWLRQLKGDVLLVEYPKDNSEVDIGGGCPAWLPENIVRDYNPAYEFFYQRVHRQKLFGYSQLPSQERAALGDLSNSRAYEILSRYGIDYIVVHTQDPMIGLHPWPYPQENPLDGCWSRRIMKKPERVYEKFKRVVEFADGVIYQL